MRQPLSVSVYIQTSLGTGCLDKSYGVCSRECEKEQHRNVFEKHDDSGLIVIEHRERGSEKDIPRNAVFQEQAKSRARYEEKYYVKYGHANINCQPDPVVLLICHDAPSLLIT